ncbi:Glutathione-regulated potassium-efflux system protein KefB (fragment) [Nitrospira japonica]|uniref:Glutathione-regulated potassium-efflux system protein KefB n=1 Tax=Nitrospira japonica TaxID=1325564 RepID=A0A1W1I9W0_9BACT
MNPYLSLPHMVVAITLLLTISAVMIPLARWLGIGPELGLLLSGVILGSSHVLNASQVERLADISQLGVTFFLFVIGLEVDPRKVWSLRRYAFGLGTAQLIGTGLAMMLYWRFFSPSWSLALLLGLVVSNSSTALVLQLLKGKGELEQEYGQAALALLLFQDLTVVPILALLPVFAGTGSAEHFVWWDAVYAVGVMVIIYAVGRYLWPRLLHRVAGPNFEETFTAVLFIALFGSAWLASAAGLSMAMGAFIAGVSLGGSEYRHRLEGEVLPLKNLLLGLFFVSVGLTVNFNVLSGHVEKILLHIVAIVVIKIVVLYLAARAMSMQHGPAARMSFLLAQGSEFAFVVLGTLLALGTETPVQFSIGIIVVATTMVMTPWLNAIGIRWSRWDSPLVPTRKR